MLSIKDYVANIDFKIIKPQARVKFSLTYAVILQILNRFGINVEKLNTHLPVYNPALQKHISKLCKIPKASSYSLGNIINHIVAQMPEDAVFLNVGVWHGFTFLSGLLHNTKKRCIGVDNFCVHKKINAAGRPEYHGIKKWFYKLVDHWARTSFNKRFKTYKSDAHHFHEMDYVDYFKYVHREPIGFYIYDAQHRYKDQLRGLKLAEPYFTDNCIIFIDDTNASDNRQATLDFIEQSPFEYEMLLDAQTYSNRHPTFWNGIMIFKKKARVSSARHVVNSVYNTPWDNHATEASAPDSIRLCK